MERMPVFVKVEEYNEVLNLIQIVRKKLDEATKFIKLNNPIKIE